MEQKPLGYNVHTGSDIQAMLATMGLYSIEQLFADVPAQVRLRRELDMPPALSEWELMRDVRAMAAKNSTTLTHSSFLDVGAGMDVVAKRLLLHDGFILSLIHVCPTR